MATAGEPASEIAEVGEASAPIPNGRRARRKAETRQRLLAAARRLFVEKGFEATRPQDIARAADVAAGTFYLHFADRREAFEAFTAQAADELMEHARRHSAGAEGFEDGLRLYLEALLDFMDENPGVLRAAFADGTVIGSGSKAGPSRGPLRDRLAHALADGLRGGMESGEFHVYDPLLISYAIVGLIQQALVYGVHERIDRDAILADVTRFCGRALLRADGTRSAPQPATQARGPEEEKPR